MSKKIPTIWRITWGLVYAGILLLNFFFAETWPAKAFACFGIGLNIPYALRYSKKDHLLQIALAFTLLSDVILAINNTAFLGVFVFTFVQFFHFARLTNLPPHYFLIFLIILTLITYLLPLLGFESMFVIGTFYACFLCANLILSIKWHHNSPSKKSFAAAAGFTLFALCDVCVAASYFAHVGILPLYIYPIANYFSWVFYYPSQVLISNSPHSSKILPN